MYNSDSFTPDGQGSAGCCHFFYLTKRGQCPHPGVSRRVLKTLVLMVEHHWPESIPFEFSSGVLFGVKDTGYCLTF